MKDLSTRPVAPPRDPAPAAPRPRPTTIPEVIAEMTRRWRALQGRRDWRAVFAKSYLRTTENIQATAQQAGSFENPAWLVQLDCDFAGRYFTAIDCWDAGTGCPAAWAVAFEGDRVKRTLVLQDLLLGMNAHINFDLPYALDATIPPNLPDAELASYARDHDRMNELLARTVKAVGQATSEYDPAIGVADAELGPGAEQGVAQLIRIWRARSWAYFLLLRRSANRADAEQMIEQTAHDYGLLLLQVQQVAPYLYWPNRLYRDSIGWLRGWF
jgi:hypothetical protein